MPGIQPRTPANMLKDTAEKSLPINTIENQSDLNSIIQSKKFNPTTFLKPDEASREEKKKKGGGRGAG